MSRNFMSCNFMSCVFMSCIFMPRDFDGPSFSYPAFSVDPLGISAGRRLRTLPCWTYKCWHSLVSANSFKLSTGPWQWLTFRWQWIWHWQLWWVWNNIKVILNTFIRQQGKRIDREYRDRLYKLQTLIFAPPCRATCINVIFSISYR